MNTSRLYCLNILVHKLVMTLTTQASRRLLQVDAELFKMGL